MEIYREHYKIKIIYIMDNKILPIEATLSTNKIINMKNTTQIKRKRCRNGTRKHRKTHRCRKVLKKIIKN